MDFIADFFEAFRNYLTNLLIFFSNKRYLQTVFNEEPSRKFLYLQIIFSMAILMATGSNNILGPAVGFSSLHLFVDQVFSGDLLKRIILWVLLTLLVLNFYSNIFGRTEFEKKALWNIGFYHLHFMVACMLLLLLIFIPTRLWNFLYIPSVRHYSFHIVVFLSMLLTFFYFRVPFKYATLNFKPITKRLITHTYILLLIVYSTLLYTLFHSSFGLHQDDFSVYGYDNFEYRHMVVLQVDSIHNKITSGFLLKYTGDKDFLLDPVDSSVYFHTLDTNDVAINFSGSRNPSALVMKKNDYINFTLEANIDTTLLLRLENWWRETDKGIAFFTLPTLGDRRGFIYEGSSICKLQFTEDKTVTL